MLIRYGWLIANYHRGFTSNSRLVIWLHGMPWLPKESEDKDVIAFLASWYDFISPDYYGSHCSDGVFSPQGCIDTMVDTYHFFKHWWEYINTYTWPQPFEWYKEITIVWASFGAWFAGRVHQYIPECAKIGLFYSYVECTGRAEWEYVWEMTNEEDIDWAIETAWQKHLYRGRWSLDWQQFLEDQRWQSYDEMIQDLSAKNVFIVHGDADECVHVGRSRKLYQQLQATNPSWNHRYIEIPKWWHGWITKQIGVVEFCKWLNWR